jgi:uncharacterized damage-inducible protein DinB
MTKNMIAVLFEYNTWANAKILDKAALLSENQLTAPTGHSHGSLRELILHMMRTEWVWRNLCQFGAITKRRLTGGICPRWMRFTTVGRRKISSCAPILKD